MKSSLRQLLRVHRQHVHKLSMAELPPNTVLYLSFSRLGDKVGLGWVLTFSVSHRLAKYGSGMLSSESQAGERSASKLMPMVGHLPCECCLPQGPLLRSAFNTGAGLIRVSKEGKKSVQSFIIISCHLSYDLFTRRIFDTAHCIQGGYPGKSINTGQNHLRPRESYRLPTAEYTHGRRHRPELTGPGYGGGSRN